MAYQNLQTYSGNRITIEQDGKIVGLIQSLRASDSYALEDASGVGSIQVVEHVPSKAVHTLSITNGVLFRGNMRDSEISWENGVRAMQGLVFDIVIYGNDQPGPGPGGTVLRTYYACSFDSGDIDITAHRITMQSAQFKALDAIGLGI